MSSFSTNIIAGLGTEAVITRAIQRAQSPSLLSLIAPAFTPITIGGAIAGTVLGKLSADAQNKVIEKRAKMQMAGINEQITRARFQRVMQTDRVSRQAQAVQGRQRVVASTFAQGASSAEAGSNLASHAALNSAAIDMRTRNAINDYEAQKALIASTGSAQTQSLGMSMLRGAMSGFNLLANLQGTINRGRNMHKMAAYQNFMGQMATSRGALGLTSHRLYNSRLGQAMMYMQDEVSKINVQGAAFERSIAASGMIQNMLMNPGSMNINSNVWWKLFATPAGGN